MNDAQTIRFLGVFVSALDYLSPASCVVAVRFSERSRSYFPEGFMSDSLSLSGLSKAAVACEIGVSVRTIENYVRRRLIPPPRKLGPGPTCPARFTPDDVRILRKNLAALAAQRKVA